MPEPIGVMGWDVGGAHVKLARVSVDGRLSHVEQHACALWHGVDRLDALIEAIGASHPLDRLRHVVTMTGEMVDLFATRRQGVAAIVGAMTRHVPAATLRFYGLRVGLLTATDARRQASVVASANWCITAEAVARRRRDAVLVDIGSTTSDIIPIVDACVRTRGQDDAGRLCHDELVYTGVVRTPIMALTPHLALRGLRQRIAAEWFASSGDAYLLTGQLDRRHYQAATADGAGLSQRDCARRLARMLGRDLEDAPMAAWRAVARQVADRQQTQLEAALRAVTRRRRTRRPVTIVGAGCGRFVACRLASRLELPYVDFADLLNAPNRLRDMASVCAPAVAAAMLDPQR